MRIHPTALVDPTAQLGLDVEIGPFAILEGGVVVGDRTRVWAHAFVASGCEIGPDCQVHMGAVLGHEPQIRGWVGPGGGLVIGPGTIIREQVTIHRASEPGHQTVIGRDCLLLALCHVAHDCRVGDHATIANGSLLAGAVTLGEGVFISGQVVVHQFVQVGEFAMLGGRTRIAKDVPPFMLAVGESQVRGINTIGLRRAGFSPEQRRRIRTAYGILYRSGLSVSSAVERLSALPPSPEGDALLRFITGSRRGLCRGVARRNKEADRDETDEI